MLSWSPFCDRSAAPWVQPGRLAPIVGLLVLAAVLLPPVAAPYVVALALLAPLSRGPRMRVARVVVHPQPRARQVRSRGPPA